MEFEKLDARGLSCPQPVILVRKAIQAGRLPAEVMVETVTSRENVKRMATKMGCSVEVEAVGDEFRMIISRKA
ncbi:MULTISPECIES: sulfurtransferase TusA family protein [Sediminispirochaeta]|jgi:TusA-related sulfurtransferase|uniref:SirA family protein n=1 Tax=Sediminispirochaeta smaragdinae (strain DSM 11293 / JCM 15392 / SEBR 4228) TaxID=573413 RepID=E1R7D4_SEDSS|nr:MULTISPECIES: sulfurtransferase TusA family protein [Sediminispirochaeta]ADK82639.1 SirA family protein [Sediminispirochaeta smaragdinae DSM 11293]